MLRPDLRRRKTGLARLLVAVVLAVAALAGCGDDDDGAADANGTNTDAPTEAGGDTSTGSADGDTDGAGRSDDLVSEELCRSVDGLDIADVGVLELQNSVQISDRSRQCSFVFDEGLGGLTFTVNLDGSGNAEFLRQLVADGEGEELDGIGDIAVAVEEQGVRSSLRGDVLFDVNVIVSEDEVTGAASTDLELSEIAARALLEEIDGLA